MSDKISIYGLSGSGKSCFIFAMSQALSQGIELSNGELMTVITPDPRQMVRLYKAYEKMTNGFWPAGNTQSMTYNFNVRKALEKLLDIEITDYRGGLLDSDDDDEQEEQAELYQTLNESNTLLFFFGADTIKKAMNGDIHARFNFQYFNTLYDNYLGSSPKARKTPVLLVITKADLMTSDELKQAKTFVKEQMMQFFGRGTNLTVGITAVSLGKNLTNYKGELEGDLDIRATAGNLSIPVLFALYNLMAEKIENTIGCIASAQDNLSSANRALGNELTRSALARFFDNNEKNIRSKIASSTNTLAAKKDQLMKLENSMAAIKSYLLSGADIYINGESVNE